MIPPTRDPLWIFIDDDPRIISSLTQAFDGEPCLVARQARTLREIENLDALFSTPTAPNVSVLTKPYEARVVHSIGPAKDLDLWGPGKRPHFTVVGGIIAPSADIFSPKETEKTFLAIIGAVDDFNTRQREPILRVGMVAGWFVQPENGCLEAQSQALRNAFDNAAANSKRLPPT